MELIIEEPKSCVREMLNNKQPKNDRFVLSFTSMILLKAIGIGNEFLKTSGSSQVCKRDSFEADQGTDLKNVLLLSVH